jgi:hypothetical protein
MPTIKRWTPQVDQAPEPNVQIIPQNWSGAAQVSRSMEVVTNIVASTETKAHEDEARSILAGASAQLGDARLARAAEAEKAKGDGALKPDLLGDYSKKFADQAMAIKDSLPPSLQAHFDPEYASQSVGFHRSVQGHIAKEADAYSQVQSKSELSSAVNIAAKTAITTVGLGGALTANPDLDAQRTRVVREAQRINDRNSWTGVPADTNMRLTLSGYHLGVLESLVTSDADGKGAAAKAYLAKYSNEIDAEALSKSKVNAAVEAAGLNEESRKEADRIWALSGGDPVKAAELVRAIPSTSLMDATDKRMKARVTENHAMMLAADGPRIGVIKQGWVKGDSGKDSIEYSLLSDDSRGTLDLQYDAFVRGRAAQNTAQKREQMEINKLLRAKYHSLPLEERIHVNFATDKRFASADELGGYELEADKQGFTKAYNKDRGVSQEAFTKLTNEMIDRLAKAKAGGAWGKDRKIGFGLHMQAEYIAWTQKPSNAGTKPPETEVMKWYDNALEYGEQDKSEVAYFQDNEFAWEAKRKSEKFSTTGFEKQQPGREVVNQARRDLSVPAEDPTAGNAGKPIVQNADGSFSTERTITVEADGRHYLIPTIVDGKARPPDEAVELWKKGTNKAVGDFATAAEAETAAKARSAAIGQARSGEAEALKLGVPADAFKRIQGMWAVDPRNKKKTVLTPAQVLGAFKIEQASKGAKK